MTHRFVRLTGVQTIRGGGIQKGLSKLVAGTWRLPEWSGASLLSLPPTSLQTESHCVAQADL